MTNGKKVTFKVARPQTNPVNIHAPENNATMDTRGLLHDKTDDMQRQGKRQTQ